jgi:ATP-dependent Clp protease protease subunit
MSDNSIDDIVVNEFTEQSARNFRKHLISRAVSDPGVPIIVYIDSYGGSLDSLNSMLETIEQVASPIITVCMGKAMSCGAVLLAAGDHRFCGRSSRVMIHQATGGDYGPIESLQKNVDECKRMNESFMAFLAKRCGKSLDQLKKIIKDNDSRDLYLSAEDCRKFGIVDFIGMPHIKPLTMYQIDIAPEKTYGKVLNLEKKNLNRFDKKTKKRRTNARSNRRSKK